MSKLRVAMGKQTPYAVASRCTAVSHQQIQNLLRGITPPWRVCVETAQQLAFELEGIEVEDFMRPVRPDIAA